MCHKFRGCYYNKCYFMRVSRTLRPIYEPVHEISNNVVCATSKASDQPAHTLVKLQTDQHLEFLSLKGGCRGSSESTLVKMPHRWKAHIMAHLFCHQRISQRVVRPSLENQLDPRGSQGKSVPIFLRIPIATCEFPGGNPSPLALTPSLDLRM